MLPEVSSCLDALPVAASREEYRQAIVDQNLLGKRTDATRKESFRRLRELYGIDPAIPLFSIYRHLDAIDPVSRPVLSILVASARDPLLCATLPLVAGAAPDSRLAADDFDRVLEQTHPGQLKPAIRAATARHIAASWTQAGYLSGRYDKKRQRIQSRPAAATMALILAAMQGAQGDALFSSLWCRILDVNAAQARALAAQAHREGLLDMRAIGTIVEISFPRFEESLKRGALS